MVAIDWQKKQHLVGVREMDETHAEFAALVNALAATEDDADIRFLLRQLIEHTEQHFAREEELMLRCGFPATAEHMSDHARVLGDLGRFEKMAARGMTSMAKAFVVEFLPSWFDVHLRTMDSALASCLRTRSGGARKKR